MEFSDDEEEVIDLNAINDKEQNAQKTERTKT